MKNKMMFGLIALLMVLITSVSVMSAPNVDSLVVSNIGTESAVITGTLNETANATLYLATDINLANIITSPFNDPALIHIFSISGLTGNTQYFYQMNGTNANGDYSSGAVGNFTTNQYTITGIARTMASYFVAILLTVLIILVLAIGIKLIIAKKMKVIDLLVITLTIVFLAILLQNSVTSILAT